MAPTPTMDDRPIIRRLIAAFLFPKSKKKQFIKRFNFLVPLPKIIPQKKLPDSA